jgi:hypothetical protein
VVWVKLPLFAVIVTALVPVGVFLAAEIVSVVLPDPVTVDGLNEAVARCGNPLTLKLTCPVKPFAGVMDTCVEFEPLFGTVKMAGFADTEKSGVVVFAFTTSETFAVCEVVALVPVMVSGYVPAGVLELVVTESDDPDPLVTEAGLNELPAPPGRPLTENETVLAEPDVVLVDTEYDVPEPAVTV